MPCAVASPIWSATPSATPIRSRSPPPIATTASRSRSTTTGRASRPTGARTYSVRSSAWTPRATRRPAASASASPSPATSPAATAATSSCWIHRREACARAYGCRCKCLETARVAAAGAVAVLLQVADGIRNVRHVVIRPGRKPLQRRQHCRLGGVLLGARDQVLLLNGKIHPLQALRDLGRRRRALCHDCLLHA